MTNDNGSKVKRLKMADIARMTGVSISTVSRALAGSPLIPEATREMIAEVARTHGYVVNPFARGLRMKKTQTVGVVIPLGHEQRQLISDPFFLEMIGHLADEITLRGYEILLSKIVAPQKGSIDALIQAQRTDGLVFIGQSDQHEAMNAASDYFEPMVVWGAHLADTRYCTVGTDNELGGYIATRHLIEKGKKRIAFLGDAGLPEIGQRHQGYLRALTEAGLSPDPKLDAPAHFTAEIASQAADQLLASGAEPDGLFAASDVIAMEFIKALTRVGKGAPGDVAVIGFDDSSLAPHVTPPLTSVRQDLTEAARLMIDLLFKRMEGDLAPGVQMRPTLVTRASSGD